MKVQMKRAAGLLLMTMLTAGCASMQGIVPQSSPNAAGSLAAGKSIAGSRLSAAAWPVADWWKQFNDPQLDRLMDEALAGSPTLRVAEARARCEILLMAHSGR